jgi:hypothetical protein
MGNTTVTLVSSPESRECPSDDLEEAYWWIVSTARWEPQEEGMISTVASLPSVVKPRLNRTSRIKTNFRRWCLLASWHSEQGRQINCLLARLPPAATWNLHSTNKYFAPNLRWGCQSHRFAVKKGMSVSSGKRIIVCKKVNRASNSKTVMQCKGNWTGVHSSLVVSLHKINKSMLGKQITVGQLIE